MTPVPSGPFYFSLGNDGSVGSLAVANEDIVSWDGSSASTLFDGSDVGLAGFTIDAFSIISPTEILLSFTNAGVIPGISGTTDDSDIVEFTAASLGADTAGTFELYLDGSDVGLDADSEDIDALEVLPNGHLLVSTVGNFMVTGAAGADEDIIELAPSSLGDTTAGTWSMYFDGSDVGLSGSSEDVDGVAVDSAGRIYLSTDSSFSVPGLSGADEDVLVFIPTVLGSSTAGSFSSALFFDGSAFGLASNDIFAIDLP